MSKGMCLCSSVSSLGTHLVHTPHDRQAQCWYSVVLKFRQPSLSCFEESVPQLFLHSCGCGCGWTTRALCISHTCTAIFKHFNPLIHNFVRESIVPILSTHVLMNLSTWYTFCPQKIISQIIASPWCNSQVLLPCSLLHSNSRTYCKVNRLAFLTSHMTTYNTSPPLPLFIFFKNVEVRKLFEDPSCICMY